MTDSKQTQALKAQYPGLRGWVIGNLTRADLDAIRRAPRDCVSFGGKHPLNNEELAVSVFLAYRREAIGCIKYEFKSLAHFDEMRGQGSTEDAFFHHALITAIAFMTEEDPAILAQAFGPPLSR